MGKRFAIVIGVAAAGVVALGAQAAAGAPDVVKYDTKLTITTDRGFLYHGSVLSDRDGFEDPSQLVDGNPGMTLRMRSGSAWTGDE
jgi:hypothetical protein